MTDPQNPVPSHALLDWEIVSLSYRSLLMKNKLVLLSSLLNSFKFQVFSSLFLLSVLNFKRLRGNGEEKT